MGKGPPGAPGGDGLGWNTVRATNPLQTAEDRARYADGTLPGLEYLLDLITARRAAAEPGGDFIGTLVTATENGERLSDMEILSLVSALVTAGPASSAPSPATRSRTPRSAPGFWRRAPTSCRCSRWRGTTPRNGRRPAPSIRT